MPEPYRSNDLYFAAMLLSKGERLTATVREAGKVYWVFAASEAIEGYEIEWTNNYTQVFARSYAEQIRNLKATTFKP